MNLVSWLVAVVILLAAIAVLIVLTTLHTPGRKLMQALGDPTIAMNDIIERTWPGATEDGWEAFDEATNLAQTWQSNLLDSWNDEDPVDPITLVELINRGDWPREEHIGGIASVRALRADGAFDALARFGSMPMPVSPWPEGVDFDTAFEDRIPVAGRARSLVWPGLAEMRIAAHEGRTDDMLAVAQGLLAVGEAMAGGLLFIDLLVGVSIQQRVFVELGHLVREIRFDVQVLDTIDAMIEARLIRPNWSATLEAERVYTLATSRIGQAVTIDTFYADAERLVDAAPLVRNQGAHMAWMVSMIHEEGGNSLRDTMTRATESMATSIKQFVVVITGVRTVIAVERYRAEHDALPASLDDLTPAFLAEVPQDPLGDGPLVYRVEGDGFALYSVGADGIDHGGVVEMTKGTGPLAGLDTAQEGVDLVFTHPRWSVQSALDD